MKEKAFDTKTQRRKYGHSGTTVEVGGGGLMMGAGSGKRDGGARSKGRRGKWRGFASG